MMQRFSFLPTRRQLFLTVPAFTLTSCVTAPPTPSAETPVAVPERLDASAANAAGSPTQQSWYSVWNDPELNVLVERAMRANAQIKAAESHVMAARAMVSVAESALYPTIAAYGASWGNEGRSEINRQWNTLLPAGGNESAGGMVGLGASWEPDLFGAHRADRAAARSLAESSEQVAAGIRLVVAADVVENYQQLRGLRQRQSILLRSVAASARMQQYVTARMQAGAATAADVSQAEKTQAQLQASLPHLAALIDARRRRLAVLSGDLPEQPPEAIAGPGFSIPPAPTGQLPSAIVERRPDLRARAAVVIARQAQVKSTQADLLPRFALHLLADGGKISISGWPGASGGGGLMGLSVWMPIFTAGRLHARVTMADAELRAAMADYDQALLTALEEVETAYGFREGLDRRVARLAESSALAKRRVQQSDALYTAGRLTLGNALQAQLDALSEEDSLAQARIAQGSATVQLYRALGGGWAMSAE